MNLEQYLALARRCACFSVAPASLAQALTLLSQASADLERAFYWNKGCGGGSMLLVQSTSHDSLSRALQSLYLYPRHFFSLSQHQCKRPIDNSKRFNLPPYRVCSDPSVWPASTSMALHPPKEFESLLRLQLDPLSPSALERALLQQHSLVEQMQFLVCNTVLSPPARLARFVFADSLQEILAKIRPGTTVYPFGSAINGLGSVTSDLDLSVEMGIDVAPELEALAEYHRLQVTADVSRKGNDILGDLLRFTGQTSYKLLTPIRFLLNRLDPLSAPSSRVLPGHVPIINYSRHRALGLGVDISRSVGGEHSSQVVLRAAHWMRSLVQQVPLLIFLAYALKYLARGAHVTHHGPAFGFTSYKLTTILVHFLQVTGFAPPLEYLLVQDMSPAEVVRRIFIPLKEDWTCPSEAADVFNEFLTYLLALNPPAVTLCLRSGRLIPRLDCNTHFIHCPNPLFPDKNITRGIDADIWSNFLDIVRRAQAILPSLRVPSNSKTVLWGLPALARPHSTANFLALCASDYYKGCIFHRNIKGFIVQTGDPTGTGKNGQSIWKQKFKDEFNEALKHTARGVVSMANNGPDSNGSQFFITYSKQTMLDMKYSIFGKVIDGWDVLDELERAPVEDKTYRPLTDIHIQDVTIHANPFAE